MKRIKLSLLLALSIITLASCHKEKVTGSGHIVSQTRMLSGFEGVEINDVIETKIVYGESFSVVVSGDDNVLSKLKTSIHGNVLCLELDDHHNYESTHLSAYITMPLLMEVDHNGVSDVKVSGFEDLTILEIMNRGVGDVYLTGSGAHLAIHNKGVGHIYGSNFPVNTAHVVLSGVGNINVKVEEQLTGLLSGVGNIYYIGSPVISIDDTGVGEIIGFD